MLAIKLLGFLVLVFLPGAWITFGLPLPEMPFRARLLTGAALSPFIVSVQFYLLRLSGASFDRTVILLIVLNAPALYLVYRRQVRFSLLSGPGLLAAGIVLLVTAVGFAPFVMSSTALAYTGNPWMHAATDYMIANGDLLLEEPQLAGVRLAYPWAGYVLQAVLGYLLGTPPLVNFIWVNLTWVLLFFGLAECIVAEMGGSALARGMAPAYVSPQGKALPGVNIGADVELEGVKGYDKQVIAGRRSAVAALFDENDDSRRQESLDQMLALRRPVALVLNEATDQGLLAWLTRQRRGASIYNGNGSILWLVEATP